MSVLDALARAKTLSYQYLEGEVLKAEFLPGLSKNEIQKIETDLGVSLPSDYRELLTECSGIKGLVLRIDFRGDNIDGSPMDAHFPGRIEFADDNCGNSWVVDCLSAHEERAQVYYWCHDPQILLFQCDGMEVFLDELVRLCQPPNESLIDDVQMDRPFDVWETNPAEKTTALHDEAIRGFSEELGEGWTIVDMRDAQPGYGFTWARFGFETRVRRFGEQRIFAYSRPPHGSPHPTEDAWNLIKAAEPQVRPMKRYYLKTAAKWIVAILLILFVTKFVFLDYALFSGHLFIDYPDPLRPGRLKGEIVSPFAFGVDGAVCLGLGVLFWKIRKI